MRDPEFVHLRLHSEYSIVDGIVRIEDAVARAVADGQPALALTDLANVFALVKFYKAARGKGIKPIVGCDLWVSNEANRDRPHRLLLLCKDRAGYRRLCELLSRAYRENLYRGRAEIRPEWFDTGTQGLIALSGGHMGDVGQALLKGDFGRAAELASTWQRRFPESYYLEVMRTGAPEVEAHVQATVMLARATDLPVVATHPVQFLERGDFLAHEARVCIAEGYMLGDTRRPRRYTEEQYFKTRAEMAALFRDLPEALANSVEIAKRCNFSMELGRPQLPRLSPPQGMTLEDHLVAQARAGLARRLLERFADPDQRSRERPRYEARLALECDTIVQMGFAGYFLIVADFINWAKRNGVPVGPGRGSGAGSLVAYSLGITDLDPLRYDLLFERFLNPERVSMPDFDVDFCQDGRDRVIDYVRSRYGEESVCQIATFGTLGSKSVIRDVGRVLDLPYSFCDQLAKLVPVEGVKPVALERALELEPQLKERYENEEEVRTLIDLALKLEELVRNVGMHAGGVLIAPGRITDFCPIYSAQGSDSVISQFDKDDVEAVGLVKFDFLGLRTLTIIDWAVRDVRRLRLSPGDEHFSIERIPLDDQDTYRLLKACNTTAVFQLESRGMKDLIRRLQPDNFEDIIALVALFRPGPLQSGMVDDFINRKHGRAKIDTMHPALEAVLKPTYGVIVYQEQVMQIAQILGGYTLGAADLLRRAMGKKKPEEMAAHRSIFVKGACERGVDERLASELFDLMEKFAEYGFNKSHSAAYALVAYQTAYLKAHHPAAFMAAALTADMGDTDKVFTLWEDCRAQGLTVLPPDINASVYRFVPLDAHRIRYGLGAIKGTGEAAIEAIVKAREAGGPFVGLFDFCRRVDRRLVNRRVIEALILAGAFDAVNDHRASLLASVGKALEAAEQAAASAHQASLFGEAAPGAEETLVDAPRFSERERLQQEKKSLGFYFSGHPFDAYREELSAFVKTRLARLEPREDRQLLAGIVYAVRTTMTRRGKMAFATLDDGEGQVEVAIFHDLFERHRHVLREDELLLVEGRVVRDDYTGGLRVSADALLNLTDARTRYARQLALSMNGQASAARLKALLAPYRLGESAGGCPVTIDYQNDRGACRISLGEAWRVSLDDGLLDALRQWLSPQAVRVLYSDR